MRAEGFAAMVAHMTALATKQEGVFSHLTRIDLTGNAITTAGLAEGRLVKLLQCCPNVSYLTLTGNSLLLPGLDQLVQDILQADTALTRVTYTDSAIPSVLDGVNTNALSASGDNPFEEAGFFSDGNI
ncbi:hypothetical protein KIPB_007871 [Kipferlia bialata]|uniref:Uncharacterized protein n=1 Tax=Kipferlia bialata TaxID=797122 RepID=A0A9K3CZM6_9EUKA|nr:hypothetical protein KIPB_007871 [Kipferlia bialata]|eukprot:g7871.t1